ncbi:hypothetical protein JTB14_012487 [Gonioctena quinquepunctata]|nr:hypothetical protein JTB14_012487 [Gonioctena quinquepunctata]
MKGCTVLLFVFLISNQHDVICENILVIDVVTSPSHQLWNDVIANALVSKGHNVTVLRSNSIPVKKRENLHTIIIEGLHEMCTSEIIDTEKFSRMGAYALIHLFFEYSEMLCDHTLDTKGLQTLIDYPKNFKFDLILIELTIGPCLAPLIQKFNYPPVVGVTPFLLPLPLSELFGNIVQPSFNPIYVTVFSDDMSFWERLQNYFWIKFEQHVFHNPSLKKVEQLSRRKFGQDMHSFERLQRHISILLCNLWPGYHYPQPLPPSIIPVGGLHINSTKKLPQDLQEIMDNSKNGVILFSLGSNVKTDQLSLEKRKVFLDALGELKETVIWKFESELSNLPKNVIIREWVPQTEILAHPNTKLFISHGGAMSTIEAAHFGIPVLGIPFFGDQYSNVKMIVRRSLGLEVDYSSLTASGFLDSINEMILNPKYSQNMKQLSKILRDQPQTPLERAIFWIEFTLRHNGTHIFDPKTRDLSFFVSSSLDIHLFILTITIAMLLVLYKIMSFTKLLFFYSNGNKVKTS